MHTLDNQTTTPMHRAGPEGLIRAAGRAGAVGPLLFFTVVVVQYVLRAGEYDAIVEPISGLGAGTLGWVQSANFAVFGVLTLVFALGLHRAMAPSRLGWLGPTLIAVTAVGLLWASLFPLQRDEAGVLYDPGLHAVGGTLFFVVGALAVTATTPRMYRDERWRSLVPYSVTVAVLLVLALPVVAVLAIPDGAPLHGYGGLLQLAILAVRFPWQIAVARRMLRIADGAQVRNDAG
jgi:hypothetical protein